MVFENGEDVLFLQGAVMYAEQAVKDNTTGEGLLELDNVQLQEAADIISAAVEEILGLPLHRLTDGILGQDNFTTNSRLHAAFLYSVLRSNDICSEDADEYYESLIGCFPPLDWKLYFELVQRCDWFDYFIRCVLQMPVNIFILVLKKALDAARKRECIKYYMWHMYLQALLRKLFMGMKPSCLTSGLPFGFPFGAEISAVPGNENGTSEDASSYSSETLSLLFDAYQTVHSCLQEEINKGEENTQLSKTIISALTNLFYHLNYNPRAIAYTNDIIDELKDLIILSKMYFTENHLHAFQVLMNTWTQPIDVPRSWFMGVTWTVSESHLTFLLYHNWKNVMLSFNSKKLDLSQDWVESTNELVESIYSFHPLHDRNSVTVWENQIDMLLWIVEKHFPGCKYVIDVLLQDPSLLERERVVSCLERCPLCITSTQLCYLLESMGKIQTQKDRLVSFLLSAFRKCTLSEQNEFLDYAYASCDFHDALKTTDFAEKLSIFLNNTVSLEEAEPIVRSLCLESGDDVVHGILKRVVQHGEQAALLVKALKFVAAVCVHPHPQTLLLLHWLQPFFQREELTPPEYNNTLLLVKLLLQVNEDVHIISMKTFLDTCILTNLDNHLKNPLRLHLSLEALTILLSTKGFQLSTSTFCNLLPKLGEVINCAILSGDGNLKEKAVVPLLLLKCVAKESIALDDFSKGCLEKEFSSFELIVQFYAKDFLLQTIDPSSLTLSELWALCCFTKEDHFDILKAKINEHRNPYENMVHSLTLLLSHLTPDECDHLDKLLEECFKRINFPSDEHVWIRSIWKFPPGDAVSYAVITCLMDSTHVLLKTGYPHINFILNNFATVLKKKKPLQVMTLQRIVLDMFTLLDDERTDLYQPILLDLIQEILSTSSPDLKSCCTLFLKSIARDVRNANVRNKFMSFIHST